MYRQKAMSKYKLNKKDFPITEQHAKKIISFPCDQHLSLTEMKYIVKVVREFYNS